jgi:branched-chain amino acid transport system substrate-binding protein
MSIKRMAFALTAAAVLGLAGCAKKEEGIVRIGHAGPLTGSIAHLGKDNENGVRLALEEANAAGVHIGGNKLTFELLSEDDQADPKQGTIVAQKLVDAKVAGVIGHLNSGTTIPASKLYHDAGIAQISPSATNVTYTNQNFKTAFRVMANDAQQGKVLGEFAVNKLGAKNIAIIDDRSAYGQGLADEFEKAAKAAGATILAREFTDTTKTDFTAILTSLKGKKPDLIFYGGMDAQAGPMMKQINNLGITSTYLGGDGVQTAEFLKLAADAAEGAYASSPGVPLDKMPGGAAFAEKYEAKFNQQIQLYAPYAYDAMNVMLEAMKKADSTDPAKYLSALAGITYQGVTGNIAFDDKGDIKGGSISLYQVKDGKWEYIETIGG